MSYILDALKKSERDRTLVRGVGFGDASRRVPRDADWMWWLVAGVVFLSVAIVATTFYIRGRTMSAATPSGGGHSVGETPPMSTTTATHGAASAAEARTTRASSIPAQDLAEQAPLAEASVEAPSPPVALVPPLAEIKLLSAMPAEFQHSVPPMTVNIHVYATEESQRILYINNHPYRRGDEIKGGVRVEEVVPDGVVLEYHGQYFRLPRPS